MRDPFRDTFLGFVRVHQLHHAARAPLFGIEMIEELRRHGDALSPVTLYPILHALEAEGFLRSETQAIDGKVRRYCRSTPAGRRALDRLKVEIRQLVNEVLEDDGLAEPAKRRGSGRGRRAAAPARKARPTRRPGSG
jgi:DNA-binding PadR family transcriptional regulator